MRTNTLVFGVVLCFSLAGIIHTRGFAQEESDAGNFDRRTERRQAVATPSAGRDQAIAQLRKEAGNAKVDTSSQGNERIFVSAEGFPLTKLSAGAGTEQETVGQYLEEHRGVFGHGSEAMRSAKLKKQYTTPGGHIRVNLWQQELDGLPVFGSFLKATFTGDGKLMTIENSFVADVEKASKLSFQQRTAAAQKPAISAPQAIAAGVATLGEQIAPESIVENGVPKAGNGRQPFSNPALKDITAALTWIPMTEDTVRLGWDVIFTSKAQAAMFRVLVDAETGEPVVRECLTDHVQATYRVFGQSPRPMRPGLTSPSTSQPPEVLRNDVTLGAFDTTASPADWITNGNNTTVGNNADAYIDGNADNVMDPGSRVTATAGNVFAPPIDLTTAPSNSAQAAVVNLFYWVNWAHDRLYQIGFTEQTGNFQTSNFGRTAFNVGEGDAVLAEAQDSRDVLATQDNRNNANFSTPPDGLPPRMQMYLFDGTTPDRDGSYDAEVILHEYVHGLTHRMIGSGSSNLGYVQCAGMGEGWSDFYALALLSNPTDPANGNYPLGAYTATDTKYLYTDNAGSFLIESYYYGARRYPYSTQQSVNPLGFDAIDYNLKTDSATTPLYPGVLINRNRNYSVSEVHNVGEVWCSMLWDLRAAMIRRYPADGNERTLRLITNALSLTPNNPTFVQARDAILAADRAMNAGTNIGLIRTAFALRGLGIDAVAPPFNNITGVTTSYNGRVVVSTSTTYALPGNQIVVTGRGLDGVQTVKFGSYTATFTVDSANQITITIPAGIPSGTYSLTFGAAETPTTVVTSSFTVGPKITSLSSSKGLAGATITVNGIGFYNVSGVRFGTLQADSYTVNSANQITAKVPATAVPGDVLEVVVTADGLESQSGTPPLTYSVASVLTSLSATDGAGGRSVVITGVDFRNVTSVMFGSFPADGFVVNSPTQITATVPVQAPLSSTPYQVNVFHGAVSAVQPATPLKYTIAFWEKGMANVKDGIRQSMAVDADGNVYTVDIIVKPATGKDVAVRKFAPDGTPSSTWADLGDGVGVRVYSHTSGNATDIPYGIVLQGSALYIAAQCADSTGDLDYVVLKFDASSGARSSTWNHPTYGAGVATNKPVLNQKTEDKPTALAVDASGNVVVTGTFNNGTNVWDYLTMKFNNTGVFVWQKTYAGVTGISFDVATDVGIDSAGNVVVTGRSQNGDYDYATLKYNGSTGAVIWGAKRYNPASGDDWATALAIDANDNVYVTGMSVGTVDTFHDFATIKYAAATGTASWTKRWVVPGSSASNPSDEMAQAIAIAPDGSVYVTGALNGVGCITIKYTPAGAYSTTWPDEGLGVGVRNTTGVGCALAFDSQSNVYVGTSKGAAKYASTGPLLWSKTSGTGIGNTCFGSIAVDGTGNVVLRSGAVNGSTGEWVSNLVKFLKP